MPFFMFQQNISQFAQSLPQIGIYVNKQAGHKGWDKSDILLIFSKYFLPNLKVLAYNFSQFLSSFFLAKGTSYQVSIQVKERY